MSEIGWNMIFWMRVAMVGVLLLGAGEGGLNEEVVLVKRLLPRDRSEEEGQRIRRNFTPRSLLSTS